MPGERQFCTFHLADHYFGIDVLKVQEVVLARELTRVPLAPAAVLGLMNLRGQIVTTIDLRRRLGLPDRPADREAVNVVVRTDDGPVGLVVDEIGDVVAAPATVYENLPETLRGLSRELMLGVYKLDGRLLVVLDVARTVHAPGAGTA